MALNGLNVYQKELSYTPHHHSVNGCANIAERIMLTKELAEQRFEYRDGALYWKAKTADRVKIGERAGCDHGDGYRVISINNKRYLEHRIIFLMHNGYLPACLDHADGDRSNNRIENLREASLSQNGQNRSVSRNASGVKGVYFNAKRNRYQAQIWVDGKSKSLGCYENIDDAAKAVSKARAELHGKFANNGNARVIESYLKEKNCV